MAISAVILSFISISADRFAGAGGTGAFGGIIGRDPEGARLLLATIAGSMITVAGVAYSVTVVALTLASSQFGPRLLTNFMQDTGNQIVLGTFIATFLYCLLVLLAVIGNSGAEFVPTISLSIAMGLALVSVAVFIFFVHHAAESIHVENILAKVSHNVDTTMDRVFASSPGDGWSDAEEAGSMPGAAIEGVPICSTRSGYLQAIDRSSLLQLAEQNELVVQCQCRPGSFIISGAVLAVAAQQQDSDLSDLVVANIRRSFLLGHRRTYEQDVEFALDQLVELGVRSLSPGINDPFTAMMCLDRLGAAISRVIKERPPPSRFFDAAGRLCLVEVPFPRESLVNLAFNQIREQGVGHTAVIVRLLATLGAVAQRSSDPQLNSLLLQHAKLALESYRQQSHNAHDLNTVHLAYRGVVASIQQDRPRCH